MVYDQQGNLRFASTFETTYYEELPENILRSSLNLLKHGAGNGWYAITDIRTVALDYSDQTEEHKASGMRQA